ncbi:hypothetical protein BVX99_00510 [bacterium F16]|nr:hypothetical protein BVX99_00510 [bacterium F16]
MFECKITYSKDKVETDSSGHAWGIGLSCLVFGLIPAFFFFRSIGIRGIKETLEYWWLYPITFVPLFLIAVTCFLSKRKTVVDKSGQVRIMHTTCGIPVSTSTFQVAPKDMFTIRKRTLPRRYSMSDEYLVVVHLNETSETWVIARPIDNSKAGKIAEELNLFLKGPENRA